MSRHLSGFRAWMWQRLTAAYLLLFLPYLLFVLTASPPHSAADLLAWLNRPLVWLGCAVFVPALLLHAWIGVRDVILDYLSSSLARLVVLSVLLLMVWGLGAWALLILVKGL